MITFLMLGLAHSAAGMAADFADQAWNRHKGVYADANVGTNVAYLAISTNEVDPDARIRGFGWNAAGGYAWSRFFGLEGGFMQNYIKFTDEETQDSAYHHINVSYLAAKFTLPVGKRLSVIGKVGAMKPRPAGPIEEEDWPDTVLPYLGIGAGFAVTPNLDITIQYQGALYGVVGAGLLGAGLTYHF